MLLLEYIDLKIFLACRYPKPEIAIVKRAKELSSAETPDSFGTVQYCSIDCLSDVLLQVEEHLFDRTSCLFEIECFDYSDGPFLFVYISVSVFHCLWNLCFYYLTP